MLEYCTVETERRGEEDGEERRNGALGRGTEAERRGGIERWGEGRRRGRRGGVWNAPNGSRDGACFPLDCDSDSGPGLPGRDRRGVSVRTPVPWSVRPADGLHTCAVTSTVTTEPRAPFSSASPFLGAHVTINTPSSILKKSVPVVETAGGRL